MKTATFTDAQLKMLETPLTPDEIEVKQGARYITSFAAIRKANKIFGVGEWGYSITSPFEVTDTGQTNKNGNAIYRVQVQITLEVRGCMPIQDLGDCDSQGTSAAAMSMASKGAVSDGVKRCLRIYGPAFGLDLYDKTWSPEQEQTSTPQQQQQPRDAQARQTFNAPARPNGQSQYPQSTAAPVNSNPSVLTDKQLAYIYTSGRDTGRKDEQVETLCREKFNGRKPSELTKSEATSFISLMKQPA